MLRLAGLKKRFGDVQAVNGVTFEVKAGEAVGLLGPNGAGKTTTLSMVMGFIAPDEGEVTFDGKAIRSDTDDAKRAIGYVPQELALYEELSAEANLSLFGALYGLGGRELAARIDEALELVGLKDRRHHAAGTFSGGMKRRLNLAAALLHRPRLLLLDEPTVGVDPQSRNAIFENLEALKARGMTLVYTTHYMEEVERLCERVVIIDAGRVVADDSLRGLFQRHLQGARLRVDLADGAAAQQAVEALRQLPMVQEADLQQHALTITLRHDIKEAEPVLAALNARQIGYQHFQTERPDLEAVFLTLTGKKLRDA